MCREGENEVILDGGCKLGNDSSITKLPSSPRCKGDPTPHIIPAVGEGPHQHQHTAAAMGFCFPSQC